MLGLEILTWIGVVLSLVYVGGLAAFAIYNRKLENLYMDKEAEIAIIKLNAVTQDNIETTIKTAGEKYRPQIERLERKKKFVLDVLPFIRK